MQCVDEHFELLAASVASGLASFTSRSVADIVQVGVMESTGPGVTVTAGTGTGGVTGMINGAEELVSIPVQDVERKETSRDEDKKRRQCVAVVQTVCVIAAGVTLRGEQVRDVRKVLQSLLRRCASFLDLPPPVPVPLPLPLHQLTGVGAVSADTKNHFEALQLLEKGITGHIKRRAISDLCRSNARKLIRAIQAYYE